MSGFLVTGKLGGGKSKFAVHEIREALFEGRRVATNLDLFLDKLVPRSKRSSYIRLPDKPRRLHLDAIGHGNPDSYDERSNGLLVLDEVATWLNVRDYADKDRARMIDWFIHARKLGWDVMFIVQNEGMIDKQVRVAIAENLVRVRQLSHVKIPLVGGLIRIFSRRWSYLPRLHSATTRLADDPSGFVLDRKMFRGDDLHAAYDTRQIFRDDPEAVCVTMFHPARFARPRLAWWRRVLGGVRSSPPNIPPRPGKHPVVAMLQRLPEADRLRHWRRLEARGAFRVPLGSGGG